MIRIEGLRKVFQKNAGRDPWWRRVFGRVTTVPHVAIEDLSLTVEPGCFYSLLGANGAGKTTTMKILCTLLLPDAGVAEVAGFDVVRQPRQARERLGVSIRGERSVYWRLTGRQNLEYFTNLAGFQGAEVRRRCAAVAELVGLTERIDDYVERYSMGMKQRLAIGCALVHGPPVLLLDEPTIGLDPHGARALRSFIHDNLCRQQGVTVLYTTHYMHEAEELSDRVAILHGGRIVAEGAPAAVRASVTQRHVVEARVRHLPDAAVDQLRQHPAIAALTSALDHDDTTTLHVTLRDRDLPVTTVADLATARGGQLVALQALRPSLEDAFIALTGASVSATGEAVTAHAG